ncbi:MAG: TlpA disulfide reductase family protein [Verrucomicrobiota bacterium]
MAQYSIWRRLAAAIFAAALVPAFASGAEPAFKILQAGDETYTNVVVTSVTATDLYFTHSRGMGNVKLKLLSPDLQKQFNFNAGKAAAIQTARAAGNEQFRSDYAARSVVAVKTNSGPQLDDDGNFIPAKLYAKSFLGEKSPRIIVPEWLTPPPDVNGKFVLVEFWATWGEPCRKIIPYLNKFHEKYKDRLVIIGLSEEPADTVRTAQYPHPDYSIGVDPAGYTWSAFEVEGVPHAVLIDPKGIVRFEGVPDYLTEEGLGRLMDRYAN